MKKIISLVLTLCMLLSMLVFPVQAATSPTLMINNATGDNGKDFYVDLTISDNDTVGMKAMNVIVLYDKRILTCSYFNETEDAAGNSSAWKTFKDYCDKNKYDKKNNPEGKYENFNIPNITYNYDDANLPEGYDASIYGVVKLGYIADTTFVSGKSGVGGFAINGNIGQLGFDVAENAESTKTELIVLVSTYTNGDGQVISDQIKTVNAEITINGVTPALNTVTLDKASVTVNGTDGATVTAAATSAQGTDLTEKVTWSVAPTDGGVSIDDANGTITVAPKAKAGDYTITAKGKDDLSTGAATAKLKVERAESVYTVTVTPANLTLTVPSTSETNNERQYVAEVVDQYGDAVESPAVAWSMTPGGTTGVSISNDGKVTVTPEAKDAIADTTGKNFTVTATYEGESGGTTLTVARATANAAKVEIGGAMKELLVPADSANKDTSASYTVTVTDQYDATIESPSVTWSISPKVEGVSINETTGVVTVTNTAKSAIADTEGVKFTVTAKCGEATDTEEITIKRDGSKIAKIEVSGVGEIIVPDKSATEDATVQFTVAAKDQYGADISEPSVTWSIIRNGTTGSVTGVSIDQSGKVTVTKAAKDHVGVNDNNSFYVRAASSANPEVFGDKDVVVKRAASVVTSMTVTAADATNNFVVPAGTETMAINLKISEIEDQYGVPMSLSRAVQWTAVDGVEFTQASESNDFSSYVANINTAKMLARFGSNQRNEERVTITFTAKYDNTEQSTDATFTLANAEPTSIVLTSDPDGADIVIPTGDTPNTKTYTATVKDQYGFVITDKNIAEVTFSMSPASDTGVSFDAVTGTVSVTKDATAEQSYTVTATCGTATASDTFTVKNKKLHTDGLDVAQANFTYGESGKLNPSATLNGDSEKSATFTYTNSKGEAVKTPINAGTYTVMARYETATDIYTGTAKFTIGPKSLTDNMLTLTGTYTYNGEKQTVDYEVEDGDLLIAKDYTITGTEGQNADTYTVTVTGQGNYMGTVTKTWTITPAELTIKNVALENRAYNGQKNVTVKAVTFEGLQNGESLTDYTATGMMADANAGENKDVTVTVTLKDTVKNYTLTNNTCKTAVTINKATYGGNTSGTNSTKYGNPGKFNISSLVSADAGDVTLGTPTTNSAIFSEAPQMSGTTLTYKLKADATVDATGTITIPVSSTNYADYTIEVTVTVLAKTAQTLTADAISVKYGDSFTPTVKDAKTDVTYTVKVGSEGLLKIEDGKFVATGIGKAYIVASAAETSEYAPASLDITVNIAKRTLTVKADDKTAYVGAQQPKLTYTCIGLVDGDKLTTEPTLKLVHEADVDPMKKAGTYEIIFETQPAASENYELTTQNGTLTVRTRHSSGTTGSTGGVSIDRPENGKVTVSPANPTKGSTVTITVTPNKDQELKSLEVIDQNGNSLPLTDLGNGKFSFVMPEGKVTIKSEFGEANAFVNPYDDVKQGDWYYGAVEYVTVNGLMNGTGKGFEPNLATSRAMIWTILARMSGVNTAGSGEWYAVAQQWAIANGVSDGTMPNGTITREQLAAMLYRYAVSKGMVKGPATADLSVFADANSVSSYAVEAMQWAVSTGLISGMDGKLNPQGSATRAQVATMLMRFAELAK